MAVQHLDASVPSSALHGFASTLLRSCIRWPSSHPDAGELGVPALHFVQTHHITQIQRSKYIFKSDTIQSLPSVPYYTFTSLSLLPWSHHANVSDNDADAEKKRNDTDTDTQVLYTKRQTAVRTNEQTNRTRCE